MSDDISGAAATPVEAPVVVNPVDAPAAPAADAVQPQSTEVDPADAGDNPDDDGSEQFADDNGEPPVNQRKTAKDFIIARKNAKIAKLQAAQNPVDPQNPSPAAPVSTDGDGGGDEEADSDEISLDGLAPIVEEHIAARDSQEVKGFIAENPDFAPFAPKVERWMKHPSRRHLPVSTIFAEVAMDNMMKIGADRARAADAKAKQTQAGGGSNRGAVAPKDWRNAPPDELAAEQLRVRQGR